MLSFLEDSFPGGFFALTIRSPVVYGQLTEIQCPPLPAPYKLITASHIPGVNQLDAFPVPVLASEKVSYRGEPVALLSGPDRVQLEYYAQQCQVLVSEEPVPPQQSLAHRQYTLRAEDGSTETGQQSAQVVQGLYRTGIQEHWYAEPHGAIAEFFPQIESLTIDTASQWPAHVKRSVAQVLALPQERIAVTSRRLGVHLDGKLWYPSLIACHAALCALSTDKPVKLMLTREEDFRYSPKRNAAEINLCSEVESTTGSLLKTEGKARVDLGYCPGFVDEIIDQTCLGIEGLYRFPALNLEATAYQSAKPPQGPCAGFGLSQGFFAIERHVSRIADMVGQDPAQWRKDHLLPLPDSLPLGTQAHEQPVAKLLDKAAAMSDYYRKWATYELLRESRWQEGWDKKNMVRGIGIAAAYQGTGLLHERTGQTVTIALKTDSSLHIKLGAVDYAGTALWKHLAAEILSLDPALVSISTGEDSGPLCGVAAIAALIIQACTDIQKRRLIEPLPITSTVTQEARSGLTEEGKNTAFASVSYGVAVVEVEIDTITYTPLIRSIALSIEGGRILSEKQVHSMLKIYSIHALGWASREYLQYIDGTIPDELLYRYAIAAPGDFPPIQIQFLKNDDAPPKDIGNLPFSTIPAAYAQAVSQAMDHPFDSIPLTAQDIWEAALIKTKTKAEL
jgi:CO/xanthine dehydrogenase Mo-binding subunit